MKSRDNSGIMLVLILLAFMVVGYLAFLASQWLNAAPLVQAQSQVSSLQTQVNSLEEKQTALNSQVGDLKNQVIQARLDVNESVDQYKSKFHDLLQEHDFMLINTIRRNADASVTFNASYAALQVNIKEVGDQIALIYGRAAGDRFVALWQKKIDNFIIYSNYVNAGNQTAADAWFASSMPPYEEDSANFWVSLNPAVDKLYLKKTVADHVKTVKVAVDYWNARNYPAYFNAVHDSYVQVGVYADAIVIAIIKQHPEKFSQPTY